MQRILLMWMMPLLQPELLSILLRGVKSILLSAGSSYITSLIWLKKIPIYWLHLILGIWESLCLWPKKKI